MSWKNGPLLITLLGGLGVFGKDLLGADIVWQDLTCFKLGTDDLRPHEEIEAWCLFDPPPAPRNK